MANKDLFKQAIAEAKSVREAAIANAKEALEESLTPHLKDMLAAKLQEMEDSQINEEEAVNEIEEELEETTQVEEGSKEDEMEEGAHKDDEMEEAMHNDEEMEESEVAEAEEDEAEDDSEESEDDAEAIEDEEIEVKDMEVDDLKDLIRDIIAQEMGGEDDHDHADMDAGDIDANDDGIEGPGEVEDEEIDLDELLKELEEVSETVEEEVEEEVSEEVKEEVEEEVVAEENDDLKEALETIETLKAELSEVNTLNSKLLYVNKIFKANNLTESQKVNVIAAFDKAETVKEVKLVYETVAGSIVKKSNDTIKESKGLASKATGTTAKKPEVINEVTDTVRRMQKLAGIL